MDDLSVSASVGLSSALWKYGGSDPDAVWHHRSDWSTDEAGSGVWDRSTERGTFGTNLKRAIVTNGDFTAYVCDSAATRSSSQITLGRLVRLSLMQSLLTRLSRNLNYVCISFTKLLSE